MGVDRWGILEGIGGAMRVIMLPDDQPDIIYGGIYDILCPEAGCIWEFIVARCSWETSN